MATISNMIATKPARQISDLQRLTEVATLIGLAAAVGICYWVIYATIMGVF